MKTALSSTPPDFPKPSSSPAPPPIPPPPPDSPLSPDIPPSTGQSFPELLKNHVLDAGLHLEAEGRESAAESFYGWSLPLIRENRSRRPLDPAWARLEREITARRSRLREKL